jgi:hypothetical protein
MDPVGNSGYSFGTLQIDLGQHPSVARDMLDSYQRWAATQPDRQALNFAAREYDATLEALQRTGRQMEAAGAHDIDRSGLNRFLSSDAGKTFVHALDRQHANDVSAADGVPGNRDTALERLQRTEVFRNASDHDQAGLAGMFMKLQNQADNGYWPRIMGRVETGTLDARDAVKEAIDGLLRNQSGSPDYIESGAGNTLRGVGVFTALRDMSPANPLSTAWAHVVADPLIGTVAARRPNAANPDLGFEYDTIRSLFLTPEGSQRFIQALDRGGTLSEGDPQPVNGRSQAGFYVAGDDFVHWNRNGAGFARINGEWRDIDVSDLQRVRHKDGTTELRTTEKGQTASLLRVEPAKRALRTSHEPESELSSSLRAGVTSLDAQTGKAWDDASDRMHAGLLLLARQAGFKSGDRAEVAFSELTERHAQGELVHLHRVGSGASVDPAANRTYGVTGHLLATPAAASYEQAQQLASQEPSIAADQRQIEEQQARSQQSYAMRM